MQPSNSPIIDKFNSLTARFTERIRAYLQADRDQPRQWLPRTDADGTPRWTIEEENELCALDIPALPIPQHAPYGPDLLLYRAGQLESLDNAFSCRLASVLESKSHSLIVNASGTGKTRLLFEVLSRRWGLYFTCFSHRMASPYGSVDISSVFNELSLVSINQGTSRDYSSPRFHFSKEKLLQNRQITYTAFYSVFLTRLLVFNHFCSIGASLGLPEDVLRRRWFLLQLRPNELIQHEIFAFVSEQLGLFPLEMLIAETQAALAQCIYQLQFVALDEAQIAMGSFSAAFATTDGKNRAPILRELVHCLATAFPQQRLLVAGTHVRMSVVTDAISDVSSPYASFKFVYSLGCFDTIEKATHYLRHFFGETITRSDCAEVHSLFRGRHRFLTMFVAHVLVEGFREMDRVMNSLQTVLTGYRRPGTDYLHLPYELILRNSQLDHSLLLRHARQATFRFVFLREETTFSEDAVSIVKLGIGLFCDPNASAMIFEPLIFYRLVSWLLKSSEGDIGGIIRLRTLDPSIAVRGVDFAAGLASYLWTAFSGSGRRLDHSLAFEGRAPFWSSHYAKLVLPSSFAGKLAEADRPSDHALSVARHPGEVFEWLHAGKCPFLIPDSQFGADLLFFLRVEDVGTILVTVFTDPFAADRARRNPTVSPKEPTSFYTDSPEHRQKLLSVLQDLPAVPLTLASRSPGAGTQAHPVRFNVLRVLCFARALKRAKPYNPPVACVDMDSLLKLEHAPEVSFSYLDDIVWGPFT